MSAPLAALAAPPPVQAELVSAGKFFWEAFITLLVITDPPGTRPLARQIVL